MGLSQSKTAFHSTRCCVECATRDRAQLARGSAREPTSRSQADQPDLFLEQKTLFKVCDRMFTSRNYKDCFAYLQKAHADCEDRVKAMDEYRGVVVINPGEELGLVRDDVPEHVRREMMRRSSSIADSRRTTEEEPDAPEARCLVRNEVLRLSGSELEQPMRLLEVEA